MLVTTPSLDDMVLPGEQVLFRSGRNLGPAIALGLLLFIPTSLGIWFIAGFSLNGIAIGLGVGSILALCLAAYLPKAQVLITDKRLLIRAGTLLVWELVTHLGAIASIEMDERREIEIVCRDGERTEVNTLPSLRKMIAVIVDLTGVDAPVILPRRLKPWGDLTDLFWAVGAVVGLLVPWFAIAGISAEFCGGPCFGVPTYVGLIVLLPLLIPSALLSASVALAIPIAIMRLALPISDTRMVFDAAMLPPKSVGGFGSITNRILYFPATAARKLASRLYGERI